MSTYARNWGLLGQHLGHSYSPRIYAELAGLDYVCFEREPTELADFFAGDEWEGLNVTVPYKRAVIPHLDELTPLAARLGAVNTVVRLADGRLRGGNTDYFGFQTLLESLNLSLEGELSVVFGWGGAGRTCRAVLQDMGSSVMVASRKKQPELPWSIGYDELEEAASNAILAVNATPVGMWPQCPECMCSLSALPALKAFIDIVYNPARTGLMMEAERLSVSSAGGLLMLVAQAARAIEAYTGTKIRTSQIHVLTQKLSAEMQNITLIGMPGSGKTRVGQQLAEICGRPHVDIDYELETTLGCSCADFITYEGEARFREKETEVLARVAKNSGQVISCGGGVVTREVNYPLLHQNSIICMIDRPLAELAHRDRPLTARYGVEKLAEVRMPLYRAWADLEVKSTDSAAHTAAALAEKLKATI